MKIINRYIFVLFLILASVLFVNRKNITYQPWLTEQSLEYIGYASGNGEATAIIADASETIVVINSEGELLYKIRAEKNASRSFISAELVEIDEYNNLYVYDKYFGGAFEENTERILKYSSKGKFIGIIYSYSYINEDFIITKGKISGMTSIGDTLYMVRLEHDGFYLECIYTKEQNELQTQTFFPYPNAFRELSYCRLNTRNRRIVWTTKSGTILEYSFSGSLINSIRATDDMSPYMTSSDYDNNFIYTDILHCEIAHIDAVTYKKTILFNNPVSDGTFYYYINNKNNKTYASYATDDILVIDSNGTYKKFNSYFYSSDDIILRYIYFSISILTIILFLIVLVQSILFLSKQKVSYLFKQIILVGICIIFGAGLASIIILREMQKTNTNNIYNELENISRIITSSIDVNIINKLQSPKDYDNEEFIIFSEKIKSIFSEMEFAGKQVYLMLWIEQNGIIYIMYDLEYCVGTFYPLGRYEDSNVEAAYLSRRYQRFVEREASGIWQYVMGPIFDNDRNLIAAVEAGYNVRSVEEENRKMLIQVILIVIATTITFMLFVIECLLMLNAYNKNKNEITGNKAAEIKPHVLKLIIGLLLNAYQKDKYNGPVIHSQIPKSVIRHLFSSYKTNKKVSFHPELIRAAAFFMYFSINFATALLPVYAARLYIPVFNFPREFIITLPFTAFVFFTVSALILIPNILGKFSIKKISLTFSIMFFTGSVLCVIAENIIHLSVGYSLLGLACGTFGLLFNTIIGAQENTEDVNNGFAHLNASYLAGVNVGIVSGSIVAQFFAYKTVFWCSSGIALLFLAIIIFSIRSELVRHYYDVQFVKDKNAEKFALIKFIFKPVVLCTLLLALMPYVATMSFTEYFMPVFGMENGLNEANIGQLMLLSGLFTILFGTSFCEFTRKKIPIQIIVLLSCLLNVIAIYLFSLNVSIVMLIISVLIIAIVNIFALTNIQTYYTLLYQHGKVSSVKAFGTYSIVENSSMAVGPVVFSYILANDISSGMKTLAFVIFGCTILFTATSALYHKKSKIRGFFRRSNDTYGAALKSKGNSERSRKE